MNKALSGLLGIFIFFSCSKPVPLEQISFKNGECYLGETKFTGTASGRTSSIKNIFMLFPMSVFSDSIMLEFDDGTLTDLTGYINGGKILEIVSEKDNEDVFTEVRNYNPMKYFPDRKTYEATLKNGRLHGKQIYYYPKNGFTFFDKVKSEQEFVEGVEDGSYTVWYENGDKKAEGQYTKGYMHGTFYTYFDQDEVVQKKSIYNKNRLIEQYVYSFNNVLLSDYKDGKETIYPVNGEVVTIRNGRKIISMYKNGVKDGVEKEMYSNGELCAETYYKANEKHGSHKVYYESGELNTEETYANGKLNGLSTKWNKGGQKSREYNYVDDRYDGVIKEWYADGKMWKEIAYTNGIKNGSEKSWYKNGQPAKENVYAMGKITKCMEWYDDGKKWKESIEETLENGDVVLHYESWYTNGNKAEKYQRYNGQKHGYYEKWYSNGQKSTEIPYEHGRRVGPELNWSKSGEQL
ncbi:toxin-antitoxin system YwqK family antitoxin [Sporocytophaga myxococcoides]|nr:toxin-antitoxin system YwqK family antitoxin [Sporocytophaga myxococcoides]